MYRIIGCYDATKDEEESSSDHYPVNLQGDTEKKEPTPSRWPDPGRKWN